MECSVLNTHYTVNAHTCTCVRSRARDTTLRRLDIEWQNTTSAHTMHQLHQHQRTQQSSQERVKMMMMIVSTRVADTAIFLSFFFFRCCWFLTFVIIAVLFSPGWFGSLLWCSARPMVSLAHTHEREERTFSRSHTHTQYRLTWCHWKIHMQAMRAMACGSDWIILVECGFRFPCETIKLRWKTAEHNQSQCKQNNNFEKNKTINNRRRFAECWYTTSPEMNDLWRNNWSARTSYTIRFDNQDATEQCSELMNDGSLSKAMCGINYTEINYYLQLNRKQSRNKWTWLRVDQWNAAQRLWRGNVCGCYQTNRIRNWLDKGRNIHSMCAWWMVMISNQRSSIGCNEWDGALSDECATLSTSVAHNWCTQNQNGFCQSQCDVVRSNDAAKWSHCERE